MNSELKQHDVYVEAWHAVLDAARAAKSGQGGEIDTLLPAAFTLLNCLIAESNSRPRWVDVLAKINSLLTEYLNYLVVSDTDTEALGSLRRAAEDQPWWPILNQPNGSGPIKAIFDALPVGKNCQIRVSKNPRKRPYSLMTPMNWWCWGLMRELDLVRTMIRRPDGTLNESILERYAERLDPEQRQKLCELFRATTDLPEFNIESAKTWARELIVPYVLIVDPDLKTLPNAGSILKAAAKRSKTERKHPCISYVRSELLKRVEQTLAAMARP